MVHAQSTIIIVLTVAPDRPKVFVKEKIGFAPSCILCLNVTNTASVIGFTALQQDSALGLATQVASPGVVVECQLNGRR